MLGDQLQKPDLAGSKGALSAEIDTDRQRRAALLLAGLLRFSRPLPAPPRRPRLHALTR